ncbi:ASCH domain-containing protein [Streptomyces sp. sk2.1]|uniref:ASCH domain-containing protein n=1 Tax=Streptomyces sp. sk2.1 TaxID=2478959 RepID=UPI0011E6D717|nr:ASCH domain-containing protein [Streptomyces sp. sk2.1]TXS68889.1 ASCH domain-containing protein [Streptomyces sp. sk2.1]
MKALTIRQHWTAAIAHGAKRTENRSWPVPAKHIGTRILIHAAADIDRTRQPSFDVPQELTDGIGIWPDHRSAIVAITTLGGCHFDEGGCCAPWGMSGYFHWALADVIALPTPVPAKGALGFWTPPVDVLTAVLAQQTEAAR